MNNVKNDTYYAAKIKKDLCFIVKCMQNVSIENLGTDEILQDSMMFRMIQISENAKKLSEEYKNGKYGIPWKAIYGLRNRIVHDYGEIDLNIIYQTLTTDIPELVELFKW